MPAIPISRLDYSSADLRRLSQNARTPEVSQRMLAIANILDGMSREKAAWLAGMTRQRLSAWVHRYNEESLDGLYNRKAGHVHEKQDTQIREIVIQGLSSVADGVAQWRYSDLRDLIEKRCGVSYSEKYIGHLLKRLGLSHLIASHRPPLAGCRLNEKQRAQIREIVLKGPDLAVDGVAQWRYSDLRDLIEKRYGVLYHEKYIGRLMKRLGLSHQTAHSVDAWIDVSCPVTMQSSTLP